MPQGISGFPGVVRLIREMAGCFPDTGRASPEGLLCRGGNLSVPLLLAAYSRGIFPCFSRRDPILWWSPSPRCVLLPENYHLPRRSRRQFKAHPFRITLDQAFGQVISGCADREETWISDDIRAAYTDLFALGFVHSLEAWDGETLAGGLYGLALGRVFYGESMFHRVSGASRACLAALVSLLRLRGMTLLDCQQETEHIMAQGASLLDRKDFEGRLADALRHDPFSEDALTREYGDSPSARAVIWPFLPWRTVYGHDGEGWHPLLPCQA